MTAQVPDIEALDTRLVTVERRAARLMRAAAAASVAAVLVGTLAGAMVYRERRTAGTNLSLEAQQVVLRDPAGTVRAYLGISPDGSVVLVMGDASSVPGVMLGVGPGGTPALGLSDPQGRLRAAISVEADGAANVGFLDESQMVRTMLGTAGDGTPSLNLIDHTRRLRAALETDTDGTSLLRLFDRAGQPLIALGLSDDAPSLVMRNADGALLGRMPGQ